MATKYYAAKYYDDFIAPYAFDTKLEFDIFCNTDMYCNHEVESEDDFNKLAKEYGGYTLVHFGWDWEFIKA